MNVHQNACLTPHSRAELVRRVSVKRLGLNRLKALDPVEPIRRYPGDMIHIDIKKLGRFDRISHRIRLASSVVVEIRRQARVRRNADDRRQNGSDTTLGQFFV